MILTLAVSGYRSLRDVRLALGPLNVVTGPNGSGKSSLYRALRLLADIAQGRIIGSVAAEGGLSSTLWAGPETIGTAVKRGQHPVQGTVREKSVSLKLGFADEDYGYAIDLGLPLPESNLFDRDPEIKAEALWAGETLKRSTVFAARNGATARLRGEGGEWRQVPGTLAMTDSMMTHCADPRAAPEILGLRERMRSWRFYDNLRTDREALARRPQVGTATPVLSGDGADLAAAWLTIQWVGDPRALSSAVDNAFPGASVEVRRSDDGYVEIGMRQHGLLRPLKAAELSEGTLRYLLLIAALLTPRPPPLMVLNEPEASLHPDLLVPLARLIAEAATRSQVIVVSHAPALVEALGRERGCERLTLRKHFGETLVEGREAPRWTWPSR